MAVYRFVAVLCLLVAVTTCDICTRHYVCNRPDAQSKKCYEFSPLESRIGAPCEAPHVSKIESLDYLDKLQMRPIISQAWQKSLNTNQDPANKKWYENGANGDNIGLYGGLTDRLDPTVWFDQDHKQFTRDDVAVFTADADNRNGLNPNPTVSLSYTHSFTQTQTHSTFHQFNTGVNETVVARADIFGIGVDSTTEFFFDYTYSVTDTKSTSTTDTTTFKMDVPLTVPTGQVYRVVLQATKQLLSVPTLVYCYVSGESETWFESRVNGHYDWVADAGTLFGWIKQYATAGSDSPYYGTAPSGDGYVSFPGSIEGENFVNFCSKVYNITGVPTEHLDEITKSNKYMVATTC